MKLNPSKTTGVFVSLGCHTLLIILFFVLPSFNKNNTSHNELKISTGGTTNNDTYQGTNATYSFELSSEESFRFTPDENAEVNVPAIKPITHNIATLPNQNNGVDKNSIFRSHPGISATEEGMDETKGLEPKENVISHVVPIGLRTQISIPDFSKDFTEEGSLVFRISVDAKGMVTKIKKVPPSTIVDTEQINKAQNLIRSYLKFEPITGTEEVQIGYYTVVYKKR